MKKTILLICLLFPVYGLAHDHYKCIPPGGLESVTDADCLWAVKNHKANSGYTESFCTFKAPESKYLMPFAFVQCLHPDSKYMKDGYPWWKYSARISPCMNRHSYPIRRKC